MTSERPLQMVDLATQYGEIREEVLAAIEDVIDETAFIRGPAVQQFEQELATSLGGSYCVGVGNGTDALQIAMMALGIGPGDEVITTPFTFIATAEAALLLGARPVWVDIEPSSYNIDPEKLEAAITPRTRAIVPVHLFGRPADMPRIMSIAREKEIAVIEDNAQSIGSQVKGTSTGFVGDLGCLSFFPSKNLGAFGDGGAVLTNDAGLHERVRMIANHGSRKKYLNEIVGVNSRLDTMQAAILRVKLRRLDAYIERRQRAADQYDAALSSIDAVEVPERGGFGHVFHQYTIRVPEADREALASHLKAAGIPTAIYYPIPLHRLPVFDDAHISLPVAEQASRQVLSLPMHTELSERDIARVSDAIASYFKG